MRRVLTIAMMMALAGCATSHHGRGSHRKGAAPDSNNVAGEVAKKGRLALPPGLTGDKTHPAYLDPTPR